MGDAVWISMVTGVTSVASGLLGYGVSRGQLVLEGRRIDADSASGEQAKIETTRAERRDLYLRYLSIVDETWKQLTRPDLGPLDWHEWWSRFSEVDNEIELLGGDSVQAASYPLWSVLDRLGSRVMKERPEDTELPEWAQQVWSDLSSEFNDRRGDVIAAMRIEVGSSLPPAKEDVSGVGGG